MFVDFTWMFFRVFPWRLFCMQVKLFSAYNYFVLGCMEKCNKCTNWQTDNDGQTVITYSLILSMVGLLLYLIIVFTTGSLILFARALQLFYVRMLRLPRSIWKFCYLSFLISFSLIFIHILISRLAISNFFHQYYLVLNFLIL